MALIGPGELGQLRLRGIVRPWGPDRNLTDGARFVTLTRLLLFAWLGRLLRSWSRLAFRVELVLLVGVLSPCGALADELVPR